ncbi:Uma2 family endonuclease [Dyadobacter sp. 3J3]|uniref:Uma2 family endonuclease n=1 Tax=Dyadobacter sp. 3J3 TaxID=2606600 RepID=UPI001358B991|nr:Uma2 family endonuclease [Dyadobacter sp. 3J3]
MNTRLLADILNQPDAYYLIEKANNLLNQERECRLKFYDDVTEQGKVEFINGEVIVHFPVTKRYNVASGLLYRLLSIYSGKNNLGFVGIEKIMITLTRNDYEPDICFFRKEKSLTFTEDQTLFPAPDLVIEILSDSTAKRDRGIKFKDYQAHKIEEYWIIDPENQTLEQYHLKGNSYDLVLKSSQGLVTSFVVDGFQIPILSIFDEVENFKTIVGF